VLDDFTGCELLAQHVRPVGRRHVRVSGALRGRKSFGERFQTTLRQLKLPSHLLLLFRGERLIRPDLRVERLWKPESNVANRNRPGLAQDGTAMFARTPGST